MKFYTVIAHFDMSTHSDLEVKQFLNLDNALVEAAYQVNEFLHTIPYNGKLDQDLSNWDRVENDILNFYGVSHAGEDFATISVKESTFEDAGINAENYVTLHTYADELVTNEDGVNDNLDSAWFTVERGWAEDMAIAMEFNSLDAFLTCFTYDDTTGWIDEAAQAGVLLGAGVGDMKNY